jgi:uncharacterized damage-inducible protein DinB
MDTKGLRVMYEYNAYANRLVLDVVARLSDDEFRRESSPSHGSVHALLRHMLVAEAFFLAVSQGRALDVPMPAVRADFPPFVERLSGDSRAFLSSATPADLDKTVSVNLAGRAFQSPPGSCSFRRWFIRSIIAASCPSC